MKYRVRHVTEVRYDGMVNLARFNLRLKPAAWPGQSLIEHRLSIDPSPGTMAEDAGPFVVNVERLTLDRPIRKLTVTSAFTVAVDHAPASAGLGLRLADVRREALVFRGLSAIDPASYLFASPIAGMAPEIADWAAAWLDGEAGCIEAVTTLMRAINDEFTYDSAATKADTPPLAAFRARRGVCQDFAPVMNIALRHFGIPAAYVSGYLRTLPPPGRERLVGADATHAWVNVWCGAEAGWIGFDPTNAMRVGNDHIFTAMGRDFGDVSPLDGVFIGGGGQRMQVSVEVAPLVD